MHLLLSRVEMWGGSVCSLSGPLLLAGPSHCIRWCWGGELGSLPLNRVLLHMLNPQLVYKLGTDLKGLQQENKCQPLHGNLTVEHESISNVPYPPPTFSNLFRKVCCPSHWPVSSEIPKAPRRSLSPDLFSLQDMKLIRGKGRWMWCSWRHTVKLSSFSNLYSCMTCPLGFSLWLPLHWVEQIDTFLSYKITRKV